MIPIIGPLNVKMNSEKKITSRWFNQKAYLLLQIIRETPSLSQEIISPNFQVNANFGKQRLGTSSENTTVSKISS